MAIDFEALVATTWRGYRQMFSVQSSRRVENVWCYLFQLCRDSEQLQRCDITSIIYFFRFSIQAMCPIFPTSSWSRGARRGFAQGRFARSCAHCFWALSSANLTVRGYEPKFSEQLAWPLLFQIALGKFENATCAWACRSFGLNYICSL